MWQCKKCKFQKKDEQGFKLLGDDFVLQCPRCGVVDWREIVPIAVAIATAVATFSLVSQLLD